MFVLHFGKINANWRKWISSLNDHCNLFLTLVDHMTTQWSLITQHRQLFNDQQPSLLYLILLAAQVCHNFWLGIFSVNVCRNSIGRGRNKWVNLLQQVVLEVSLWHEEVMKLLYKIINAIFSKLNTKTNILNLILSHTRTHRWMHASTHAHMHISIHTNKGITIVRAHCITVALPKSIIEIKQLIKNVNTNAPMKHCIYTVTWKFWLWVRILANF